MKTVREQFAETWGRVQALPVQTLGSPVPVQTLGSWHLEAAFKLHRIGLALAKRSSGDEKVVVTHFFQRLAVFLQRGNAHLILSRQPTFPERHVDGD